jgi:NADH:ubiquinone oxidoreductase subunit C
MTIDVRERLRAKEGQGTSRLISVFPIDNADGTLDLIYMFQHGTEVAQYRYTIDESQELESLADLFKGALNMEREAVDLFGLRFKGVQGGLLLCPESGVVNPMRKPQKQQEHTPEVDRDA